MNVASLGDFVNRQALRLFAIPSITFPNNKQDQDQFASREGEAANCKQKLVRYLRIPFFTLWRSQDVPAKKVGADRFRLPAKREEGKRIGP